MKKRFVIETRQNISGSKEAIVLVDRATGVCYLSFNGGITPMLNSRGDVLTDSSVIYGDDPEDYNSIGTDAADGEGFDDEFDFNR